MDFQEINFEEIRKFADCETQNVPIDEYKYIYKSFFESFERFCQSKKKYDINIYTS